MALKQDFQNVFGLSMVDLYDPLMSWIEQRFCIDLVSFDAYLHSRFGEYENSNRSMEDIIRENYGPDGLKLINVLI